MKGFPDAHQQLTFKLPRLLEGKNIQEIHIIPIYYGLYFKITYCYQEEDEIIEQDADKYLSIDLGLDNFATFVDNCTGTAAIIYGMYVKSTSGTTKGTLSYRALRISRSSPRPLTASSRQSSNLNNR